jgi:hypothetical protein
MADLDPEPVRFGDLVLCRRGFPVVASLDSDLNERRLALRSAAPGLLADAAVDPLAEQVGVAEVAGVLLDHVEYHLAQRDRGAVSHGAAHGEVGRAGDELLREGDLLAPGPPGAGDHRRIGSLTCGVSWPIEPICALIRAVEWPGAVCPDGEDGLGCDGGSRRRGAGAAEGGGEAAAGGPHGAEEYHRKVTDS